MIVVEMVKCTGIVLLTFRAFLWHLHVAIQGSHYFPKHLPVQCLRDGCGVELCSQYHNNSRGHTRRLPRSLPRKARVN